MTHLCTTDPQEIAHLDYSKPPPGYLVHDLNDDGWWWRIDEPEDGCTAPFETEAEAIAAAWAHYKAHNDPPGLEVGSYGDAVFWAHHVGLPIAGPFQAETYRDKVTEASLSPGVDRARVACRAAAWAWHDRRYALSVRPSPRRWYSKAPPGDDAGSACIITIHRSPEAAKKAVLAVLEDGSEGWPEDVEAVEWGELVPMSKAQEYDRETTPEGEFDYVCKYRLAVCTWPRCLTWSDEQVAEVERWLQDSTAEMPEVLRA